MATSGARFRRVRVRTCAACVFSRSRTSEVLYPTKTGSIGCGPCRCPPADRPCAGGVAVVRGGAVNERRLYLNTMQVFFSYTYAVRTHPPRARSDPRHDPSA